MEREQIAREAYAAGWVLSGGPMTDRVRAGCTVAMGMAANLDGKILVEATLKLGQLEGTLATILADLERVHDEHGPKVLKAVRKLTATVDSKGEAKRLAPLWGNGRVTSRKREQA